MGPAIKKNPLQMSVYLLALSYVVGEFIIPIILDNYYLVVLR